MEGARVLLTVVVAVVENNRGALFWSHLELELGETGAATCLSLGHSEEVDQECHLHVRNRGIRIRFELADKWQA